MRYLKNYKLFKEDVVSPDKEKKSNEPAGKGVPITADSAKKMDTIASKVGIDLDDEDTLGALMQDLTDQIDQQLDNPNPKLMIRPDAVKEKIEHFRKYNQIINEGGGHGGGASMLMDSFHLFEAFLTWGEAAETSAHNILGKIGHGHDDHHGVTEDHIDQSKALLKKHKKTILDRIKSILTGIKGLSTAIYKLTIGLLDRVIIWFCRNVLRLSVTTSAKAGQVVLLIIGIICALYAAVFVLPASVAALKAGGLWNILSSFIPFVTKGGFSGGFLTGFGHGAGAITHFAHSIFGLFRTYKSTKSAQGDKESMTFFEFADELEKLGSKGDNPIFRKDLKYDGFIKNKDKPISTTAILRLKAIMSHLKKDQVEKLSQVFKNIIENKKYEEIKKIPYFNQFTSEFEGEKLPFPSKDLDKGFFGLGHSKFETWLEEEYKIKIDEEDQETYDTTEEELEKLKNSGVEQSHKLTDYQKYADKLEDAFKGSGHLVQKWDFEDVVKNESDWIILFFQYGIRNDMNLIRTFRYEIDAVLGNIRGGTDVRRGRTYDSTKDIIKYLKKVGCKNVEEQFEYFGKSKNAGKLNLCSIK